MNKGFLKIRKSFPVICYIFIACVYDNICYKHCVVTYHIVVYVNNNLNTLYMRPQEYQCKSQSNWKEITR